MFSEARAAAEIGLKTTLVVRPGNKPLTDDDKKTFHTISSFCVLFGEDSDTTAANKK